MSSNRYILDLTDKYGTRLNVESVSYTETNAIVPLTGRFTYYNYDPNPLEIGEPYYLMLYQYMGEPPYNIMPTAISQVFIRHISKTETDAKYSDGVKTYKFDVDFECDIGIVMEQVVSFGSTYFNPDEGLTPQAIADVVCETYASNIGAITVLEPDMRIRDFQFMGKRYEALAKLERTLGAKAYIHRDDLEIVFVPTYYDSSQTPHSVLSSAVMSPFVSETRLELSTGVAIRGETNTVSQVTTVSKSYRLGPDSWSVFVNRADLDGDPSNNSLITGLVRATISHPDVYNLGSPLSAGISNVKIDGVTPTSSINIYDETTAAALTDEPENDFMIVLDETSVDFYRVVSGAANVPTLAWAEAIVARKAKEMELCTLSFDVYGNNFRKYFYVVSGSAPYEEMETNDPASTEAAQRCANIIAEGRTFQHGARMYIDADSIAPSAVYGRLYRPGELIYYDGETYLIDEVTCQSHPYSIVLKLLRQI